ncbi:MAG: hemerythrin domain-containing protein [Deltaproteobacteria bacterium]|jgi:hemerythrin-like domain-containing protein|nr:hemerythrin domain-containing protein [Deltaproteobacteria bacterium]
MPPLKRDPSLVRLSHDHHQGLLRAFFIRQALRTKAGLDHQAAVTRDFFRDDLVPHFRAEEEVLFPLLVPLLGDDAGLVDALLAEHRELETLTEALDGSAEKLTAYAELLDRHIRTEERRLFELYQERVPEADRPAIEARLREARVKP